MPKRIKLTADTYELRGAQIRVARKARPCDSRICAKYGITIEPGDQYAYVSTGHAYCNFQWDDEDVEEVTP